ncbi:MAG: lysylphosphatidylglycerol synthase transmembrane domain-containing protein [Acidimicrobiales bacterium]|nr:lysylphosphatidylglycerol synthase transmembrane domain-containing protein [Acidimicrobiales bacterium]
MTTNSKHAARISTVIGALVALGGAVFVATRIAGQWPEAREALRGAAWGWLVPATLAAAAGMTWFATSWRSCIRALGDDAPIRTVIGWYYLGQLGKYLPGGLWPLLGRGEMATRSGLARPVAYNSVALSMAVTYLAAAVAVVVLLPVNASAGEGGTWWLLAAVPVGAAALHPSVLGRLLRIAERVLGDGAHPRIPAWTVSIRLIARHLPGWAAIGLATWLVALAFDPDAPLVPVVAAGIFSWIVGFVAIPVPGGIGVREAAFVAAAGSLAPPVAATVAVVSRLLFMVVDAGGAAVAAGPLRPRTAARADLRADRDAEVSESPSSAPSAPRGDDR